VGNFGSSNVLVIANGGLVNSFGCFVGYSASSNNSILVTDPGSVWSNRGQLSFNFSSPNSLIISNGGQVISPAGGFFSRDKIVVTGTGSIWNSGSLHFDGGSLLISNNADVANSDAYAGYNAAVSNLQVRVVDSGSWQNGALYLGYFGSSNSLVVAGGSVSATNLVIGFASANCNNLLQVDSGNVVVTNATHDAVLEIRQGELVLNGGTIQTDVLVMTNSCASLVHTGGTLIVGSVILDPNAFRITSVIRQGNDVNVTWLMGPGQTNTLQATTGNGSGGYSTNGFADIFAVTNNPTAGTSTNYLDVGAGTNVPARYYRARLVP
jgi:T5SS/PEP-CTERM-associated repeat protein